VGDPKELDFLMAIAFPENPNRHARDRTLLTLPQRQT
jgi:hypothetical protein